MTQDSQALAYAADLIGQSDAIIVGAGAGMGVDSGLPDFRGNLGFWKAYPALQASGLEFTAVASPDRFRRDPRTAWGFYGHRLGLYRSVRPHDGFRILKNWADRALHGGWVYTSNVDGQFQRAGFDTDRIVECHGSIHHFQCSKPCWRNIWDAGEEQPDIDTEACLWRGALPTCPRCGELARPNVLMFGDVDWISDRTMQQRDVMTTWLDGVRRPVFIELGAGVNVPSVRHFGHLIVQRYGGRIVRINPRDHAAPTPFDIGLPLGALEGLRLLDGVVDFQ